VIEHGTATPAPPSRAVVLGASGVIGQVLTAALRTADIPTAALASAELDLAAPDAGARLAGVARADDCLVFVSAVTPDRGRDLDTFMKNVAMGRAVARILESGGCAHAVYISSDAVYGDDVNPIRETSACDAPSLHGLMHFTREGMLAHAASVGRVPLVRLRVGLVYGPRDTHNSYGPNRFLRTAIADRKITLFGNGEEKRDHVYVADVAAIALATILHRSWGVLNVVSGTSRTFGEVADIVARLTGGAEIVRQPRQSAITHRHFDVHGLRTAFPAFVPTPLSEGLAATVAAMATR